MNYAFRAFDRSGDKLISYDEFLVALRVRLLPTLLKNLFRIIIQQQILSSFNAFSFHFLFCLRLLTRCLCIVFNETGPAVGSPPRDRAARICEDGRQR